MGQSVAVTPDYLKDLPEAVTMFGSFAYGLLQTLSSEHKIGVFVRFWLPWPRVTNSEV